MVGPLLQAAAVLSWKTVSCVCKEVVELRGCGLGWQAPSSLLPHCAGADEQHIWGDGCWV